MGDGLSGMIGRDLYSMHGPQVALVVDVTDPDQLHRIKISLVSVAPDLEIWARVVCPFAGADRGAFFMPDVGDEVLVVFQNGDPRHPMILGGMWNGSSPPPAEIGSDGNRIKRIRSKNGVTLTLDDQDGQERFKVETPGGQSIELTDGPGQVVVRDASGNTVTFESGGMSIEAAAKASLSTPQLEITAGMVKVDSAMADFSGVVKCQTLIANSVVSTSYTPGAGNVW